MTTIVRLLWPELTAFADRTLGKGTDADDAAQLALEKIFAQAISGRAGGGLRLKLNSLSAVLTGTQYRRLHQDTLRNLA